jgi:hypothetical protein
VKLFGRLAIESIAGLVKPAWKDHEACFMILIHRADKE